MVREMYGFSKPGIQAERSIDLNMVSVSVYTPSNTGTGLNWVRHE